MGVILRPGCKNCGHSAYHCIASGCNHHDENGWCDCDEYEAGAVEVDPETLQPRKT